VAAGRQKSKGPFAARRESSIDRSPSKRDESESIALVVDRAKSREKRSVAARSTGPLGRRQSLSLALAREVTAEC